MYERLESSNEKGIIKDRWIKDENVMSDKRVATKRV